MTTLHSASPNMKPPPLLSANAKRPLTAEQSNGEQTQLNILQNDTFEAKAKPRRPLEAVSSSQKLQKSNPANPTALLAVIAPLLMGSVALAVGFYGLMKGHTAEIKALEKNALNQAGNATQALAVVTNKVNTLETAQIEAAGTLKILTTTVEHQTKAMAALQAAQTAQSLLVSQLETKIETENELTKTSVQLLLDGAKLDQEEQLSVAIEQQLTAREQAKIQQNRAVRTTFVIEEDGYLTVDELASYEYIEPEIWAETSIPIKRPPPAPPTVINQSDKAVQNAALN
jgi:hypothetical protein